MEARTYLVKTRVYSRKCNKHLCLLLINVNKNKDAFTRATNHTMIRTPDHETTATHQTIQTNMHRASQI